MSEEIKEYFDAIKKDDVEEVKQLIDDAKSKLGFFPRKLCEEVFLYAAQHNKANIIKSMITDMNVDINTEDNNGRNALDKVARTDNNEEIIEFLLSKGIEIHESLLDDKRVSHETRNYLTEVRNKQREDLEKKRKQEEIDNNLLAKVRKKITKGTVLENVKVPNTIKANIEMPISDTIIKAKKRISSIKENIVETYDKMDHVARFFLGASTVAISSGIVGAALYYADKSEVITLKEDISHDENTAVLFKAAFENNLDDFKEALKNKADIKVPNKHNQNVLMVALACGSYDVSGYILTTPELRDKIDYKQADDKGVTAIDIIQSKIDYALHKTGRKERPQEPAPELMMAKRVITEQLQKQSEEEANGHPRSNTKYDAFSHIMKSNNGNTGL